jgi:citronellol/citronellal dehydrogenase
MQRKLPHTNGGEARGHVALVTGASRGIGTAIAERLAAEGAAVAVTARSLDPHPSLPGTLRETVHTIERRGGRAIAIKGDLLQAADRAAVVRQTEAELGPIDILVNNAAAAFYMPFERYSEKRYHVAFEVNVRAPFEMTQLVLPGMRARKRGWILNISTSLAAHPKGPPYDEFAIRGGGTLYGMTKAALDRLSSGLAAETFTDNIVVNSLSPVGAVMTPGAEAHGIVPEEYRANAEPVEAMAEAALALCVTTDRTLTGRILYSIPILDELGRPVRTLDGARLLERSIRGNRQRR